MGNIYKLSLRDGVGERGREFKKGEKSNELCEGKEKENREINWPFILCKRVQKY